MNMHQHDAGRNLAESSEFSRRDLLRLGASAISGGLVVSGLSGCGLALAKGSPSAPIVEGNSGWIAGDQTQTEKGPTLLFNFPSQWNTNVGDPNPQKKVLWQHWDNDGHGHRRNGEGVGSSGGPVVGLYIGSDQETIYLWFRSFAYAGIRVHPAFTFFFGKDTVSPVMLTASLSFQMKEGCRQVDDHFDATFNKATSSSSSDTPLSLFKSSRFCQVNWRGTAQDCRD